MLGNSILSEPFGKLFEPELHFFINAFWMSQAVRQSVDGALSPFQLDHVTTMASKWCICDFSRCVCPGALPNILDYSLQPASQ